MKSLKTINAKNFVLFNDQQFKFSDGVTVVYGNNKDSDVALSSDVVSRNAVGKSLIFSSIPILVYGTPPAASGKRESYKSFLKEKTAFSFSFANQQKDKSNLISIACESKGKSGFSYAIEENKKPLDSHRIKNVREAIQNLFGIREETFYSTVMVSIYRPSPLWKGSSSERYDFFKKVFELDFYDKVYKSLSNKLSELKSIDIASKEVDKIYREAAQRRISAKNISLVEEEIANLEEHKASCIKTIGDYRAKLDRYRQYIALFEKLNYPTKTKAEIEATHAVYKEQGQKLTADFKSASNAVELYTRKIEDFIKNKKAIDYINTNKAELKRLKTLIKKSAISRKDVEKQTLLFESKLSYLEENSKVVEAAAEAGISYDKAKKLAKGYDAEHFNKLKETYDFIRHNNSLFDTLKKTNICPICKTKHTKSISKSVSTKRLAKEIKRQDKMRIASYFISAFPDGFDTKEKLNNKLNKLAKLKRNYEKAADIKEKLKAAPDVAAQTSGKVVTLDYLNEKLKKYQDIVKTIDPVGRKLFKKFRKYAEDMETHTRLNALINGKPVKIMAKYNKRLKEGKKHNEKLQGIEASLSGLKIKLFKAIDADKKCAELELTIKKYKKKLKDIPMIKKLQLACGPSGVRVDYVKTLVNNYVHLLNEMAPFIYNEPYVFSANIEKRKFDIIVNRNGKPPTDVKYLSGSECHRFLALSAVALRALLPKNMRFSNIIFDEIEGSSSDAERQMFTDRFIPYLLKTIPSITLVTPASKDSFTIRGARDIIVEKNQGKSTINHAQT